jgi:Zn-dependent M16 (insulinase) family peptidase
MYKIQAKHINYFSIALCVIIVTFLLSGCNKKKIERFENKGFTDFQNRLVNDVKNGKIDGKIISKYIKEKKLTKNDLNSIISNIASSVKK